MDTEKKKFVHEYFALEVLKLYRPSCFQCFIKSEEPDFIDEIHNCGIEVSSLIHNDSRRADAEFNKYCHPSSKSMKEKSQKYILESGMKLNNELGFTRMIEGGGYNGCYSEFVEIIKKKLEKVNNYKAKCDDIFLFIEADALCFNDLVNFPKWIEECQLELCKKINRYYFYFDMRRKLYLYENGKLSELFSITIEAENNIKEIAKQFSNKIL